MDDEIKQYSWQNWIGELVNLDIEDIDFEQRECIVFAKGDKERKVYFDAKTKIHLKKYLDEKGTNVRKIAKATGISATTLYSIIQKDSNIRFDFALRLANELQIDVNEICSASPFSDTIKEEEIYPTLPDGLNGALDASRVKTYLKNSMYPLMYLFGKNSMPDVDNLLTSFYQLDDET